MVSREPEVGAKLHPSTTSHFAIETAVLRGLIDRSKFQHRSQPFLQRMREVYRLAKRFENLVSSPEDAKSKTAKTLLLKFVQALLKAAISTQQIIALEHFLPTHISVLAVYGRLFALASHLGHHYQLDVEELLGGQAKKEDPEVVEAVALLDRPINDLAPSTSALDLGQKIARTSVEHVRLPSVADARPTTGAASVATGKQIDTPAASPSPSPSPAPSQDSPDPDFPVLPTPAPAPRTPVIPSPPPVTMPPGKSKKKRTKTVSDDADKPSTKKIKKKKRDDIDDIFGL